MVAVYLAYILMFLALGVGVMIAIQAQVEYESAEPELGEVPESSGVKRHRTYGWKQW